MEPGRRDTARSRAIRALAWLSLALVSCLDASFLSAPSAVGPQGGAFTFAGGAVVLQVPPGAVAQPVGLSVEPARAFTPSELVVQDLVEAAGRRVAHSSKPTPQAEAPTSPEHAATPPPESTGRPRAGLITPK